MDKNLQDAFEILRKIYGTHCLVADAIGITADHYRKMRNGRANIPDRTADYIILKAKELGPCPPCPPPAAETSGEARPS